MQRRLNHFMLLFVILAVVLTNAVRTTVVYADDGVTETPTGESAPPAEEAGTSTEEAPPAEQPVAATEAPAQEPASEEPVAATEVPEQLPPATETPVNEVSEAAPPAAEPAANESGTVPEILEQLPEGTDLVVVNEEGETEPLATAEAAEIVATGDPMWCPAGQPPIANTGGCTGSYGSLNELIEALKADANGPGNYGGVDGVIWVQSGNLSDTNQVELNGQELPNLSNNNDPANSWSLTINGGWNGDNLGTLDSTTQTNVSMVVVNWTGDITINNFQITGQDNVGFGLVIQNDGDSTLDNVTVSNTAPGTNNLGDGAIVASTGNVQISNSKFNNNPGQGLVVQSLGNINLNTVEAQGNTLTGAYLDSCLYGLADPGLCAGNGLVTITSASQNLFGGNGYNTDGSSNGSVGLYVDSGGGINIDHVSANGNGLDGADLQSLDDDGTGNVQVSDSEFNGNANGLGLSISTDGSITAQNLNAYANGGGALLITRSSTGSITVSNSNFGVDAASGNDWTGLDARSDSSITLNNVIASYNGDNGAYLEAQGNILVSNSTFSGNVQFNDPTDPGLYASSNGGTITLTNVTATGNEHGAGVVLETGGTGTIEVTGGQYNGNGTFGVQAASADGNITLADVIASFNGVKGAYLHSYWSGDITINNSTFTENGVYGIYASTSEGEITLNGVTVLGSDGGVGPGADDLTDNGAVLEAGGDVTVSNSTFQYNTNVGLKIVSGGQVTLDSVVADQNGGNGVEIYSLSTAGAICEGDQPVSITVNVTAGAFTDNGGYGLTVKPGSQGTLVFLAPSTFGGNGLGDYLLDLQQSFKDCSSKPEEPSDSKPPLIVEVPPTGGPTVAQDCDQYSSTILELPNGTWVKIGCPFEGFSNLEQVPPEELPSPLGAGIHFLDAIHLTLTDAQGSVLLNEDGTVTISFVVPEDSRDRSHSILFWDETRNDGKGGWVRLPVYEAGTRFPLNPDNPDDPRIVVSGVKQIGNVVTVTVNFSGLFTLVTP